MSAPVVVSVNPSDQEIDIVLGQAITVVFDQAIDVSTLNENTFSLTFPAPAQILTSNRLLSGDAAPQSEDVPGSWSFSSDVNGCTVAVFTPTEHYLLNTLYTAMLLGSDASLASQDVMNPGGEPMAVSYQWSFTTGILHLTVPPPSSPLLVAAPAIQPEQIKLVPRKRVGQDLAQEILLIFPDDIDPNSFSEEDLLLSVEPLLGDPGTSVPADLQYQVTVDGNKLRILISGF